MNHESDPVAELYFSEMSTFEVLSADEELSVAERVVQSEVDLWVALLSYRPALAPIYRQLTKDLESIDEDRPTLPDRGHTSSAKKWTEKSAAFGRAIRLVDNDRAWTRAVVELALSLDDQTAAYKDYCVRVRRANRLQRQAKDVFITRNLRLVVSVARKYSRGRTELTDIIQDGNLGLIKGVEKYDHTRGFRFSTYATWWIRHAITRSLADKSRAVRIPVHLLDAAKTIERHTQKFVAKHGREPSSHELADETGIPIEKIQKCCEVSMNGAVSLDRPIGEDGSSAMVDRLVDEQPEPSEHLSAVEWSEETRRLLGLLSPTESSILRWRFGLDDDSPLTLEQIGQKYHLTRERIRQLQEQAIGKIRKHMRKVQMEGSDY